MQSTDHPWLTWLREMPDVKLTGTTIPRQVFGSIASAVGWFGAMATVLGLLFGPLPLRLVSLLAAAGIVAAFVASTSSRLCDGIGYEHLHDHRQITGPVGIITDAAEAERLGHLVRHALPGFHDRRAAIARWSRTAGARLAPSRPRRSTPTSRASTWLDDLASDLDVRR